MKRKYTWISTKQIGETVVVMAHHKDQGAAKSYAERCGENCGYKGPVPLDLYPIGRECKAES